MTLSEFYDYLGSHDWYWFMSDDPRVSQRGRKHRAQLELLAMESEEHQALFNAFDAAHVGPGSIPAPKPERPVS